MAPEQLAGEELTERTDIYALGLVLYELFTGKPVFKPGSVAEMARLQRETTPTSLASHVDNLDPAVERGILRCLETDAAKRPDSALTVAAGLPGGDPLAAALAAGETPSPAMVAEAGSKDGLRPAIAIALLLSILLGLVGILFHEDRVRLTDKIPLSKPPAELAVEARRIIEASGWTDPPADHAFGFNTDNEYFTWVTDNDSSDDRWANLNAVRPSPLYFWYRQSARPLVPSNSVGWVGQYDPPLIQRGMVSMRLDPVGRLLTFVAVAPDSEENEPTPAETDWGPFFEFAGLEMDSFEPVQPTRNPPIGTDHRSAWTGHYPEQVEQTVRVEAGSVRGHPVNFEVFPEWRSPQLAEPAASSLSDTVGNVIAFVILTSLVFGGALLAWRNDRLGRGDRRGALRLAAFLVVLNMLGSILRVNHVPILFTELDLMGMSFAQALFRGALIWLFYMAAEPYVRRIWPDSLITWTRLLDGRFRDPLLGRHLLIGAFAGLCFTYYWVVFDSVLRWLGARPDAGRLVGLHFPSSWFAASNILEAIAQAFTVPVAILLIVLLFRVLLRRQWLAFAVLVAIFAVMGFVTSPSHGLAVAAYAAVFIGAFFFVLTRFGLFTGLLCVLFSSWESFALTLDPSSWYFGRTIVTILVFAALAIYGFVISLAGRRIFKDSVFDDPA
jgi:serine/threonine-protein kinase